MFYVPTSFLENILREDIPYNDCTTEALGISGVPGKISCFPKKTASSAALKWVRDFSKKSAYR